ncbi:MAG: hypothetical protein A2151_04480 [Candidatus Muproteobacteria bacterium RBG_16_65_34]|uniref:YggT family protein n=1 Tax=Candidatus Muproteobacteria bacterium RBG_16_65_34 TaxID=1817760 RepID=A0A1F6TUQ4_9PROT|nr:MAG: hypothetical protein A2151_04480 [Candidatus Muproteobacteria bacterium RBG_16_65_34]
MNAFLTQAAAFLIQVAFGFYILTVLLRLLFQLARADFYNPISQFVVAITNPALKPLRRAIPGLLGIDLASVVLLLLLKLAEFYLLSLLGFFGRVAVTPLGLGVAAVLDLTKLALYVYIFAILIRVILSWFNPHGARHNPALGLVYSLSEPLLAPARRLIPPVSGMDLSPLAVLVLLQLAMMLLDHLAFTLLPLTG